MSIEPVRGNELKDRCLLHLSFTWGCLWGERGLLHKIRMCCSLGPPGCFLLRILLFFLFDHSLFLDIHSLFIMETMQFIWLYVLIILHGDDFKENYSSLLNVDFSILSFYVQSMLWICMCVRLLACGSGGE